MDLDHSDRYGTSTREPNDDNEFSSEAPTYRQRASVQWDALTPEEIERIEDDAINVIQHAYRAYRVRAQFRFLVRQSFMKVFDKEIRDYVYINKMTGNRFRYKPSFLGDEDLPIQRIFAAPLSYIPRKRRGGEGFALMVTVSQFQHPRIPHLAEQLVEDHKALTDALTHDFYGRIGPQNILSLVNPKREEFVHAFELMKKMTRGSTQAFLIVYLCTHVVQVIDGERSKGKESREKDCYFLVHDSVWSSAGATAASAVSLVSLSQLVRGCGADSTTLLLHLAHLPPPRRTLIKRSKTLYPPEDCLCRLAELARAAVVGSCCTGTRLEEAVRHSSPLMLTPFETVDPMHYLHYHGESMSFVGSPPARTSQDEEAMARHLRRMWRMEAELRNDTPAPSARPQATWSRSNVTGEIVVKLPRQEEVGCYSIYLLKG